MADATSKEAPKEKKKGRGGRRPGARNKRTLERIREAELRLGEAGNSRKRNPLAVDYMDEMVTWFHNLVDRIDPFNKDGTLRKDRDAKVWFKAVELYQSFLAMRAPYQSPRLNAVQIIPAHSAQQRTTVNVTILNEKGEKVYADADESDMKLIEHENAAADVAVADDEGAENMSRAGTSFPLDDDAEEAA